MGMDNPLVVVERKKARSYTVAPANDFLFFSFYSFELVGKTVKRILGSHPRNYTYICTSSSSSLLALFASYLHAARPLLPAIAFVVFCFLPRAPSLFLLQTNSV